MSLAFASYSDFGHSRFSQDENKWNLLATTNCQYGKTFVIIKIRTIHPVYGKPDGFCLFLRRWKLDEIPQLFNILLGSMSFVGPRPDIPGYYDRLEGESRLVLQLKPGITSEASIRYRNEEELLSMQSDALWYNDNVIFPEKVRLNLEYYYTQSFMGDLRIMIRTFI